MWGNTTVWLRRKENILVAIEHVMLFYNFISAVVSS